MIHHKLTCLSLIIALTSCMGLQQEKLKVHSEYYPSAPYYMGSSPVNVDSLIHVPIFNHGIHGFEMIKETHSVAKRDVKFETLNEMNGYLQTVIKSRSVENFCNDIDNGPEFYVGERQIFPDQETQLSGLIPGQLLRVKQPSERWKAYYKEKLSENHANSAFFIYLTISNYEPYRNILTINSKHGQRLDSDDPVEVLQFHGILLDKKGNIVRVGSEGILLKEKQRYRYFNEEELNTLLRQQMDTVQNQYVWTEPLQYLVNGMFRYKQ